MKLAQQSQFPCDNKGPLLRWDATQGYLAVIVLAYITGGNLNDVKGHITLK